MSNSSNQQLNSLFESSNNQKNRRNAVNNEVLGKITTENSFGIGRDEDKENQSIEAVTSKYHDCLLVNKASEKRSRQSTIRKVVNCFIVVTFLLFSIIVFDVLVAYLKAYGQNIVIDKGLLDFFSSDLSDATISVQVSTPFTISTLGYTLNDGNCVYSYVHSSGSELKIGDIQLQFHQPSDYFQTGKVQLHAGLVNTDFRIIQKMMMNALSLTAIVDKDTRVKLECTIPVSVSLFRSIPIYTIPISGAVKFGVPQVVASDSTSGSGASSSGTGSNQPKTQSQADAATTSLNSATGVQATSNSQVSFTAQSIGLNGMYFDLFFPLSLFSSNQVGMLVFEHFNVDVPAITYSLAPLDIQNTTSRRLIVNSSPFSFDVFDPNANISSVLSVTCATNATLGINSGIADTPCTLPEAMNVQSFLTMLINYGFLNTTLKHVQQRSFLTSSFGTYHFMSSMDSAELSAFFNSDDNANTTPQNRLLSNTGRLSDELNCLRLNTDNIYATDACLQHASSSQPHFNVFGIATNIYTKNGLRGWIDSVTSWTSAGPFDFNMMVDGYVSKTFINGNLTVSEVLKVSFIDLILSDHASQQFLLSSFNSWNFSKNFDYGVISSNILTQSNYALQFHVDGSGKFVYGTDKYSFNYVGNEITTASNNQFVVSANGTYSGDINNWEISLSNSSVITNGHLVGEAEWLLSYSQPKFNSSSGATILFDVFVQDGKLQNVFQSINSLRYISTSSFYDNGLLRLDSKGVVSSSDLWNFNSGITYRNGSYSFDTYFGLRESVCLLPTSLPPATPHVAHIRDQAALLPTLKPSGRPSVRPSLKPTARPMVPPASSKSSSGGITIPTSFCVSVFGFGSYLFTATMWDIALKKGVLVYDSNIIGSVAGDIHYDGTEDYSSGIATFSFDLFDSSLVNILFTQNTKLVWLTYQSWNFDGLVSISSHAIKQNILLYQGSGSFEYNSTENSPLHIVSMQRGVYLFVASGLTQTQSFSSNFTGDYYLDTNVNSFDLTTLGQFEVDNRYLGDIQGRLGAYLMSLLGHLGYQLQIKLIDCGVKLSPTNTHLSCPVYATKSILFANSTSVLGWSTSDWQSESHIYARSYLDIPRLNEYWNANVDFRYKGATGGTFSLYIIDYNRTHHRQFQLVAVGDYSLAADSITVDVTNSFIQLSAAPLGYATGSLIFISTNNFDRGSVFFGVTISDTAKLTLVASNISTQWAIPSSLTPTSGHFNVIIHYSLPEISHVGFSKAAVYISGDQGYTIGLLNASTTTYDSKYGYLFMSNSTSTWASSNQWQTSGRGFARVNYNLPTIHYSGESEGSFSIQSFDQYRSGLLLTHIVTSQTSIGHIFTSALSTQWSSPVSWFTGGSVVSKLTYNLPALHYNGGLNGTFAISGDGSGSYTNFGDISAAISLSDSRKGGLFSTNSSLVWQSSTQNWLNDGYLFGSTSYSLPFIPYRGFASGLAKYKDDKYSIVVQDNSYSFQSKSLYPLLYANASGAYKWLPSNFYLSLDESILILQSKILLKAAFKVGVQVVSDWSQGRFLLSVDESGFGQSLVMSEYISWSILASKQYLTRLASSYSFNNKPLYAVTSGLDLSLQNSTGYYSFDLITHGQPLFLLKAGAFYNQSSGLLGKTSTAIAYQGNYLIGGDSNFYYIPPHTSDTPTSPVRMPTSSPLISSGVPSRVPSSIPVILPPVSYSSFLPSMLPTLKPSLSSNVPSGSPASVIQTKIPVLFQQSLIPSIIPSVIPSMSPSLSPSLLPSRSPSTSPSQMPSWAPNMLSLFPSYSLSPSALPSSLPSLRPSSDPSIAPSLMPSAIPSLIPTFSPSTFSPTTAPSKVPSLTPSLSPTVLPSISIAPSIVPTVQPSSNHPTYLPSSLPSISLSPTISPTSNPSIQPSSTIPSVFPSLIPSISPTISNGNSVGASSTNAVVSFITTGHNMYYLGAGFLVALCMLCVIAVWLCRRYRQKTSGIENDGFIASQNNPYSVSKYDEDEIKSWDLRQSIPEISNNYADSRSTWAAAKREGPAITSLSNTV